MDAVLAVTGRDVEEQELALSIDLRTMRWIWRGSAADFRMSQERRQILDALVALGRPVSPAEVAAAIGKPRFAVNRLLLKMATGGEAQWLPGGKYQLAGKAKDAKPTSS